MAANGIRTHLAAFERIARANGGNRAAGTKGYERSARYVYDKLEAAGYAVRFQEFPFGSYVVRVERGRQVRPTSRDLDPDALEYSPSTRRGGVTAKLAVVPVDEDGTHGCEAGDFSSSKYRGRIALVKRGTCRFSTKAKNASRAGAVAVIVYNNAAGRVRGTLGGPKDASIPTVLVTRQVGEALAADAEKGRAVVSLEVRASTSGATTPNVIADTRRARGGKVVMAGGHLDSVKAGPGVNDNGSGTAALLEIALELSKLEPRPNVRFAFWGAEELGLVGSRYYVRNLSRAESKRIALYLNFDMIGSPNGVRFIYAGGGNRRTRAARVSEAAERVFARYFKRERLPAETMPFAGSSDNASFEARGIPTGGLFTGAAGAKTSRQARLFGGTAGKPYDRCYHKSCDTVRNIDYEVLEQMADAAAHALATFATRPSLLQ